MDSSEGVGCVDGSKSMFCLSGCMLHVHTTGSYVWVLGHPFSVFLFMAMAMAAGKPQVYRC